MQTEATRSSHGTSDTSGPEKSMLELELEDAAEKGFELWKSIGSRFQRAHALNTAKQGPTESTDQTRLGQSRAFAT